MVGKRKILFVDDEPDCLSPLLTYIKYSVQSFEGVTATSGEEALEIMDKGGIDVLVADQRMPGMKGVELLRECHQRYPDVVRILLTAYPDFEAVVQAVNDGDICHCVLKPWSPEEMEAVFQSVLRQKDVEINHKHLAHLGMVTASLAHELNTPLAVIKSNSQLVREMVLGDVDAMALLDGVYRGVVHISDLISDIKTIADVSSSSRVVVQNFNTCLEEALSVVCIPTNVTLRLELEKIPSFLGYPKHYKSILVNLLNNACEALGGQENGEIIVKTVVSKSFVDISIIDSGDWINDEITRQVDGFFSTGGSGVGLGLTISKAVVESCGGKLEVIECDIGVEVKLRIPLKKR